MRNDFDDYCPASVSRGELEDIASITVRLMPYYGRDIEKMRDMPREQAVAYRQELREKGMFYDAAKAVDIYSHGNFCASHLSNFCKTDYEAAFGKTYNRLNTIFHTAYGMTIKQMQVLLRVNQAKRMLRLGHTISETSTACGFEDYFYFLKVFKSKTGMTPSEYRNS